MPKLLLIGGTNAGGEVNVPDQEDSVTLPVTGGFQRKVGQKENEVYRRVSVMDCSGKEHFVLVIEGKDPIQILLNSYRLKQ